MFPCLPLLHLELIQRISTTSLHPAFNHQGYKQFNIHKMQAVQKLRKKFPKTVIYQIWPRFPEPSTSTQITNLKFTLNSSLLNIALSKRKTLLKIQTLKNSENLNLMSKIAKVIELEWPNFLQLIANRLTSLKIESSQSKYLRKWILHHTRTRCMEHLSKQKASFRASQLHQKIWKEG